MLWIVTVFLACFFILFDFAIILHYVANYLLPNWSVWLIVIVLKGRLGYANKAGKSQFLTNVKFLLETQTFIMGKTEIGFEIIVGTYEEFVLGYQFSGDVNSEKVSIHHVVFSYRNLYFILKFLRKLLTTFSVGISLY